MKIEFSKVVPVPLTGSAFQPESVWERDISFSSPQYTLVRAPSGTGKSTLISLIYGTRNDYTGDMKIDGKLLRSYSLRDWSDLRRKKLSVVFQDLRLFPELTALENIRIKAQLEGNVSDEKIKSLAERLGMGHKLSQSCGTLSLGQQQRIAVVRSLVQPFEMLLLDEPFSHLDTENTRIACELIGEACRENNAGLILTSLGEPYFLEYSQTFTI